MLPNLELPRVALISGGDVGSRTVDLGEKSAEDFGAKVLPVVQAFLGPLPGRCFGGS